VILKHQVLYLKQYEPGMNPIFTKIHSDILHIPSLPTPHPTAPKRKKICQHFKDFLTFPNLLNVSVNKITFDSAI